MATVSTVLGPADTGLFARVLPHEHIFGADGRGMRKLALEPIASEDVLNHHEPLLRELADKYECRALVECSPWGFRRPQEIAVWQELSRRTGVHIIASTGYYVDQARPAAFATMTAGQIADGMLREIGDGIEGTGVRAGIIKIAISDFDAGDRKLCQAAAIAQRASGLSITTHTCSPDVRRGVLDLLEGAGVPAERIYIGHADDNATLPELLALVRRGCSVLLTIWGIVNPRTIGWSLPALPKYHSAGLVAGLVAESHGHRVLMSIDYAAGNENPFYDVEGRTHLYMFTHVLPALRRLGVGDRDIECIMRDNAKRMLEPEP